MRLDSDTAGCQTQTHTGRAEMLVYTRPDHPQFSRFLAQETDVLDEFRC